ncbi:MAG: enoyl-CoA hydratase-related protein [Actinomycetota bacterium]|nr:enoyl-CoA hydratase-related protein [Actinomycetota bacterium]
MSTAARAVTDTLVERFELKTFVEACGALEDGVAQTRDIDLAMTAGAGIAPGPFARADERGLDSVLEALEGARAEWGEHFAPPLILRRLVAQGRLGRKSGQGFFPYPRPDRDQVSRESVVVESRGDTAIIWLDRPPRNLLTPSTFGELREAFGQVDGKVRAVVIASSSPQAFSAGVDIREFMSLGSPSEARRLAQAGHRLARAMERSSTITVASVNAAALGGGCELALACDLRLSARSATFAQPEVKLGILPGFGATQRLPRLVGEAKALEMSLLGDPIGADEALRLGLVNRVVADHELFDASLAWACKAAQQPPIAVEQVKRVSRGELDRGLEAEVDGFVRALSSKDAREGISAFLEKRRPRYRGR